MDELKKYFNFSEVRKMSFKEFEKVFGKHKAVLRAGGAEKAYKLIKPDKVKD